MARSAVWDVNTPLGSRSANQVDNAIRELRVDVQECVNQLIGQSVLSTPLIDPLPSLRIVNPRLVSDMVAVNRTTAGNFKTYTLPANTLNADGMGLRITSMFALDSASFAGTVTTIRHSFPGGNVLERGLYSILPAGPVTDAMSIVIELYRDSSTSMMVRHVTSAVDSTLTLNSPFLGTKLITGVDWTIANDISTVYSTDTPGVPTASQRVWVIDLLNV